MAMGTNGCIFLVSVRCMTLSLKKKASSQNHMVFLTGNIRSLPTRNDVSTVITKTLQPPALFFYYSAEKLTSTFLKAKIQLDASGSKP